MTLRAAKKRQRTERVSWDKDLRDINVLIIHPDNEDGRGLTSQLLRIGCQVSSAWPIPEKLDVRPDVIVLSVAPETLSANAPWLLHQSTPPIVPVIAYESPVIIEALMQLEAFAVIPSPVKSFGVLAALSTTLEQTRKAREREKHIKRLEGRLAVTRTVQSAKTILMRAKGISETEAYNMLRDRAMARRESIEKIAEALVSAHELYAELKN